MASIKVRSKAIQTKADNFQNCAKNINQLMENATKSINELKWAWMGEAAEATVNRFQELEDDFSAIKSTIMSYSHFLAQAAAEYRKVELTNLEQAQGKNN